MRRHVKEMRDLSKQLTRYSFPIVSPEEEEVLSCLKQRDITVDGYDLVVYFNRCRYQNVDMETLQLYGKYFTFLPFILIGKVAVEFLGSKELSLIETVQENSSKKFSRKIYVWTVYYDNTGEPMPPPFSGEERIYNGLTYLRADRDQVSFF